jgi:hypothetical protein
MSVENLPDFGTGSFVGHIMHDEAFLARPVREQAEIVGWADGCPVVQELTDPNNPNPGRGPEAMVNRYGEVNFWFGEIARTLKDANPELYEQFTTPVERLAGEPVGKYEPVSVPSKHFAEIAPMGQLAGYAMPRIFVEYLDRDGGATDTIIRQNKLAQVSTILDKAISQAGDGDTLDLLANFSEGCVQWGLSPQAVLKHTLSEGWVSEHNGHTAIQDFKRRMQMRAPGLQSVYTNLSEQKKGELKLA